MVSIVMKMPMNARGSTNDEKLNAFSAAICAVTVVPMLAPMMTAVAMASDMTPALTKPTVMTVVADDDCIMEVVTRPMPRPASLPEPEVLPNQLRSLSFASFSIASDKTLKPNNNTPRPPRSPMTATTYSFIISPPFYVLLFRMSHIARKGSRISASRTRTFQLYNILTYSATVLTLFFSPNIYAIYCI